MSSPPLLQVSALRIRIATDRRPDGPPATLLHGVSFSLHEGETLAIVGESGAGKTLCCRALLGLLPTQLSPSGTVLWRGANLLQFTQRQWQAVRGGQIAMIFQDAARSLNPVMRIGQQIVEPMRLHQRLDRRRARHCALEMLGRLGFRAPHEAFSAYPHQLSGGMQQRALIALALAGNPKLLIADEATRSVDVVTQARVLSALQVLQRQLRMALILVTHDLRLAARLADQVLVMRGGHVLEHGSPEQVFVRPTSDYTRSLLEAASGIPRAAQAPLREGRTAGLPS